MVVVLEVLVAARDILAVVVQAVLEVDLAALVPVVWEGLVVVS